MPYPIIIIFYKEKTTGLGLSLKRINKTTKTFEIIEDLLIIDDIVGYKDYENFLKDLNKIKTNNLYEYYKDLYKKTVGLALKDQGVEEVEKDLSLARENLKEIERIKEKLKILEKEMTKERDFGRKIELAKSIKNNIKKIEELGGKYE